MKLALNKRPLRQTIRGGVVEHLGVGNGKGLGGKPTLIHAMDRAEIAILQILERLDTINKHDLRKGKNPAAKTKIGAPLA